VRDKQCPGGGGCAPRLTKAGHRDGSLSQAAESLKQPGHPARRASRSAPSRVAWPAGDRRAWVGTSAGWASLLPMVLLPGMHGLREKYWCVNRQTGECQGIYAWQRAADAHGYADAVALRVSTGRSVPGFVSHRVPGQSPDEYWAFR
jgi:hypothetical protein